MPSKPIQEVLQEQTDLWMAMPGVVGTAIGERGGRPCLVVYVVRTTETLKDVIPPNVEGYPVVLEPTGGLRAL
jgi:hypothetical protein